MDTESILPTRRVLHSWKDIASYTGRGVRTIQRYEEQLRFPIHRPAGAPRTSVLAFTDEIDRWLAECPVRQEERQAANCHVPECVPHLNELHSRAKLGVERVSATRTRISETVVQLGRLRAKLKKSRELRAQRLATTRALLGFAHPIKISPPPRKSRNGSEDRGIK